MDTTQLQILLSTLKTFPDPDVSEEQYATPPDIAADVLNQIQLNDDLHGNIVDLGCGTGVFAIGAAALGASAEGYDVDAGVVAIARENAENIETELDLELDVSFIVEDVREVDVDARTVVMNPPFGLQKEAENEVFLETAFDTAPVVYALLHRSEEKQEQTREFYEGFAEEYGFDTAVLGTYEFPLPRTQEFHTAEKKHIKVDLYKFSNPDL